MNWNDCFSPQRFGLEHASQDERSDYERDYDRIIFSSAFRRLQNKTQVFPLPEHGMVHNRLTHSLEVASVGRSLGKMVGTRLAELPQIQKSESAHSFYQYQLSTVIAAACLAHDLGNPAFGHSGEDAISHFFHSRSEEKSFRKLFSDAQWSDLSNFEGNANALRVLTRQFPGRQAGGLQVTYPTLAAILKYPCDSLAQDKEKGKHRSKYGFFQSDRKAFEAVASRLGLICESAQPLAYHRHPFVYLVEAADDICYRIMDYEDAHRLGILSFREIREDLLQLIESLPGADNDRLQKNLQNLREDPNETVAYLRAKAINLLVRACSDEFLAHSDALLSGQYKGALLEAQESAAPALDHIEEKSIARIYQHESVVKIELAGFKIMSGLLEDLTEAALMPAEQRRKRHKNLLLLLPHQYSFAEDASAYEKVMSLLDFVSGMTDPYALELYRNLRGISVPHI